MDGLFLSFEGGEALGKSVHAGRLAETLRSLGHEVVLTREPGGTAAGERIRDILLHAEDLTLPAETQALLFSAARAQLARDVIRPALAAGKIVLVDRFFDSTIAYQGYGHGASLEGIAAVTRFAVGDLRPLRTFLLDAPVQVTLERLAERRDSRQWDRFHAVDRAFHERVREGYLQLAAAEPDRFVVVKADRPEETVAAEILRAVEAVLPAAARVSRGG